ncbi:uncharacterized protein LOC125024533 [Penaeus chinensis]|uniref:uncharacterized protein LOC125024533 n=1 Tax=Penaeus chinensis TaxID=139456 RepID=UPI001FB759C9|nr:uncharacterized protein LOC125024533 [Penaeus chinensis]XP_047468285.1 uncharacterized protein LOC125024533 [Penaeus chinensis]XP_047468286.1 uncharacterized protein LOC125024533 [Penaeus chinensis]
MLAVLMVLTAWPLSPSLTEIITSHFYEVKVSKATIMASRTLQVVQPVSKLPPSLRCSSVCNVDLLCQVWCHEASSEECLLSDMYVMPTYRETNLGDTVMCNTKRHYDLATGAFSITATPSDPRASLRVKDNLIDGIYDRMTMNQCYLGDSSSTKPWLYLDFGEVISFRVVKLVTQSGGHRHHLNLFQGLEVRAGMEAVETPGNFSSYARVASFAGPATDFDQEVFLEAPEPVKARFISVQKMASMTIQICHLEVF